MDRVVEHKMKIITMKLKDEQIKPPHCKFQLCAFFVHGSFGDYAECRRVFLKTFLHATEVGVACLQQCRGSAWTSGEP